MPFEGTQETRLALGVALYSAYSRSRPAPASLSRPAHLLCPQNSPLALLHEETPLTARGPSIWARLSCETPSPLMSCQFKTASMALTIPCPTTRRATPLVMRSRCRGWARSKSCACVHHLPLFQCLLTSTQRTFKFVSIVGFVTILQATWENVLLSNWFGLYNGGTGGVIWCTIAVWLLMLCMIASL